MLANVQMVRYYEHISHTTDSHFLGFMDEGSFSCRNLVTCLKRGCRRPDPSVSFDLQIIYNYYGLYTKKTRQPHFPLLCSHTKLELSGNREKKGPPLCSPYRKILELHLHSPFSFRLTTLLYSCFCDNCCCFITKFDFENYRSRLVSKSCHSANDDDGPETCSLSRARHQDPNSTTIDAFVAFQSSY